MNNDMYLFRGKRTDNGEADTALSRIIAHIRAMGATISKRSGNGAECKERRLSR